MSAMDRKTGGGSRSQSKKSSQKNGQTVQQKAEADAKEKQNGKEMTVVPKGAMAPFVKLLENPAVSQMISEVATSTIIKPDRLIYIARAGLSRSPELLECTPISWVGAIMDCAQLGLEPIGALGQFYFVAYNNRVRDEWVKEVNGQIGYLGITELARRSGQISYIKAEAIFEGDTFDVIEGSGIRDGKPIDSYFIHKPNLGKRTTTILGAWAKVQMIDKQGKPSDQLFKVIDTNELKKAKAASQAGRKNKGPWRDWEPQMAAKTAVRRLRPVLPQATVLARALAVDESVDLNSTAGRWRDVGDQAHVMAPKIDQLLNDLTNHPTRGQLTQSAGVPESAAGVPESNGKKPDQGRPEEPPPATEPPPGMDVDGPPAKATEPSRSGEDLVKAFMGYGVTVGDLEAAVAPQGEPPVSSADWDEQVRDHLEGILGKVSKAKDADAIKKILVSSLKLEPGSLG